MRYELYDILTLGKKDYTISSMIVENNQEYFLLTEVDKDEKIISNSAKIMKRALENNLHPERLYEVLDEKEFNLVSKLLNQAMINDLKD